MNARQKAKYWKRRYEQVANMPLNVVVNSPELDRLRFERRYTAALVHEDAGSVEEALKRDLAEMLTENLDRYVTYSTTFDAYTNYYVFSGELQVVVATPKKSGKAIAYEVKGDS